jgi:hypothetical protein
MYFIFVCRLDSFNAVDFLKGNLNLIWSLLLCVFLLLACASTFSVGKRCLCQSCHMFVPDLIIFEQLNLFL